MQLPKKVILIPLLATILLLTGQRLGYTQDYAVDIRHWSVEEGLSHRNVQSVAQDDRGFIWVATQYGLNRFDGHEFLQFSKSAYNLQTDEINHMYKDMDGRLWFFFTMAHRQRIPRSIDIFDPYSETAQPFEEAFGPEPPFQLIEINSFTQKPNGELVFLLKDGQVFSYNGEWKTFKVPIPEVKNVKIKWSPTGVLWMVSEHISIMQVRESSFIQGVKEDGSVVFSQRFSEDNYLGITHIESNGTVHIAAPDSPKGPYFHIDQNYNLHLNDPFMERIQELGGDDFLIGEYNVYDFSMNKAIFIDAGRENNNITVVDLTENRPAVKINAYDFCDAVSMFTDDKGRKWISTQFGIYLLDLKDNFFVRHLSNQKGRLRPFRGLAFDHKDRLWAVEENKHLWRFDPSTGTWDKDFLTPKGDPYKTGISAFSLHQRRNGSMLMAKGKSVFEIDTFSDRVSSLKLPSKKFDYNRDMDFTEIWTILEDRSGKIWIGTDCGDIAYISEDTSAWIEAMDQSSIPHYVYSFHENRKGELWVATDRGVLLIDQDRNNIKARFWSGGIDSLYLPADIFYDIHEDEDGTFWLGTGGSGLIHWCPPGTNTATISTYDYEILGRHEGLSSNEIYAVYEDGKENLWLSSNYGLIGFDKNSKQTSVFLVNDGIAHNEFNSISHTISEDSILFFGGLNGITAFDPYNLERDSIGLNDPLVITDYYQFLRSEGQLINKTLEVIRTDSIHMGALDPFFRLEFSLLSYDEPNKVQYAYKIEGLDQDWNYIDQNFIRINKLPSGMYELRVKGHNAKGYWSEDMIIIYIFVEKPYYLKTGFLVMAFLLLSFLILGGIEYRTRDLINRRKELQRIVKKQTDKIMTDKLTVEKHASDLRKLDRVKSTFFANVSHELRTPLTLILGPLNRVIKKSTINDRDKVFLKTARKNANVLLKLVSSILDLSKIENKKLEFNEVPTDLKALFDDIESEFSILADTSDKKFLYDYQVDEDLIVLLDHQKIRTCVNNLLSNAFKYTNIDGVVELKVKANDQKIRIEVIDDGFGIHPNDMPHIFDRYYQSTQPDVSHQGGTGIGLALTKELIQMIDGKINVESELDMGSRFVIYVHRKDTNLPLTEMEETEKAVKPAVPVERIKSKGSILVVEDHEELQAYLKYILSDQYEVKVAAHGQDGLNMLRNDSFDLIITDLMMPVMDGYSFIAEVKGDAQYNQLPIIVLSAKTEVLDKIKVLRYGVDDYLTKPFDEDELRVRINNLLKRLEVRRQFQLDLQPEGENDEEKERRKTTEEDKAWLEKLENFVLKYMDDGQFGNDFVAAHFELSRRQLQRRLKKLVGITPKEYINEVRMNKALSMLKNEEVQSVKEVAKAVGFSTTSYFSKLFVSRFGRTPSDILQSLNS